MEYEFWNLLHDGGIDAIRGEVPGVVSVDISIQYLRQRFPGEGAGFTIVLANCSELTYCEYGSTPVTDFDAIVALEPEIVRVERSDCSVVVNCDMGTLTMSYEDAAICLDSVEQISFDQLAACSRAYWDEWSGLS
jgi:hypothetical protein